MFTKLALVLLLVVPSPVVMPKPGSFGFNWLDPHSHCRKLDAKAIARLTNCENSENAFGLESKALMCKSDAKTEIVIYDTAAQCQEALETMQANGD